MAMGVAGSTGYDACSSPMTKPAYSPWSWWCITELAVATSGSLPELILVSTEGGRLHPCRISSSDVYVEEETRVPMPSMVPLPSLPFSAPSGQPSIPGVFGEPLVGKPEPMGATYDAATVSLQHYWVGVARISVGSRSKSPLMEHAH
eukprot:1136993-Pelagomonas_calceolata.AAC.12